MTTISRNPSIASQKQQLPHVSSFLQCSESRGAKFDARRTLSSQRAAKQPSAPSTPKHDFLDLRATPNIHVLSSLPDFYPPEAQSTSSPLRRRRSANSRNPSPASRAASIAEGSIFELPTPMPLESPNSSVAASFVAELEDTSGPDHEPVPSLPTRSQLAPSLSDTSILFNANKFSSQAILRVVDEAIVSIEAQNRELHARAEAAEASAYRLHVSNTELRNRVEELSISHRLRASIPSTSKATQTSPKTSPAPSPRNSSEKSTAPNIVLKTSNMSLTPSTATSQHSISRNSSTTLDVEAGSFESLHAKQEPTTPALRTAQVVHIVNLPAKASPLTSHPTHPSPPPPSEPTSAPSGIPQPKFRRSIRSLKFLLRNHTENLSEPVPSSDTPSKMSRCSSERPRTADANSPPVGTSHFDKLRGAPPLPELPIFLSLTTGDGILSNSNEDKDTKRPRRLTRTVSFEEAKKIAEQMDKTQNLMVRKPTGEMSPSPIDGIVEIGAGGKDAEKDGQTDGKHLRSQRSRVRFLLKENSIKDLVRNHEGHRDSLKKKHAWLKWGKKGEEIVVV